MSTVKHCLHAAVRSTFVGWSAYQPDGPGLRRLSERQVLDYLIYLRDDQKLAGSTVNQALVPIRTLYRDVLKRDWLFPGVGRGWKQSGMTQREAMGRSKKPMSG